MSSDPQEHPVREDLLREHVYDGIQEYDQKLPNWWLFTLYGAIVFSIGYWVVLHHTGDAKNRFSVVQRELDRIAAVQLANSGDLRNDKTLWDMSRNSGIVAEGRGIYAANCASCHGSNMEGGIGVNLADSEWIHGARPVDLFNTVENGVIEKGMVAWGPVLGPQKVATVVAYVLSHHEVVDSPAGPGPGAVPADSSAAASPDISADLRDNEALWAMSLHAGTIAEGRALYETNCALCHGPDLNGGVGSSLLDSEWAYGSEPVEVFDVVDKGVIEKGMIPAGPVLGPEKVATVVAFIMSHHEAP